MGETMRLGLKARSAREDQPEEASRSAQGPQHPSWDEVLAEARVLMARRAVVLRQLTVMRVVVAVLLMAAVASASYPSVMQWMTDRRTSGVSAAARAQVAGWPYPQAKEQFAKAREYNARLAAQGQPVLGEVSDPFDSSAGASSSSGSNDSRSAHDEEYQSLLNVRPNGVMGSIVIPKVSIDLPIYHGTSTQALEEGSGHVYGTSLPVGGENTHAVLTGHRGMVEALMFTRLDELKVGDSFYLDVMDQTLGYRIDWISVIDPSDTRLLRIQPGEDRVTLMTCTPYGINTHRLLVSGVRSKVPQEIPAEQDAGPDAVRLALRVGFGLLMAGVLALVPVWWRRRGWRPMRHRAAEGIASPPPNNERLFSRLSGRETKENDTGHKPRSDYED